MPIVIDKKETGRMPAIGIRGYLDWNAEYDLTRMGGVLRSRRSNSRKGILSYEEQETEWTAKSHYEIPLPLAYRLFVPYTDTIKDDPKTDVPVYNQPSFMQYWRDRIEPDTLCDDDDSQWAREQRLRLKDFRVSQDAVKLYETFTIFRESLELIKEGDDIFIDILLDEFGVDDSWFSRKPKPHQKAGMAFFFLCLKYGWGHIALFDEMRTGKTKQAIDIATWLIKQKKALSALVVCPNTIKRVWLEEIYFDSPLYGAFSQVIEGSKKQKQIQWGTRQFFNIVNYEGARADADELNAWAESIGNEYILICDEAHKLKNPESQQSQVILNLKPKYSIFMTGTPVANRPEDIWSLTNFVCPALLGRHIQEFYERFAERGGYNGKSITGYKDLDEIRHRVAPISMRRLRKDIGFDYVVRQHRIGQMSKKQGEVYEKMRDELMTELLNNDGEWTSTTAGNKFVQILRLQQITSGFVSNIAGDAVWFDDGDNWKFKELDEFIDEYLDDIGGKLVLWTRFVPPIEKLMERYERYGATCIYGAIKDPNERYSRMMRFQTDPNCKIMIGQILSASLGLGFKPATFSIFIDKWRSPSANKQAEDRIAVTDDESCRTIISLITEDTIDERLEWLLDQKLEWASNITGDDKTDIDLPVLDKNTLLYLLAKPDEAMKYREQIGK